MAQGFSHIFSVLGAVTGDLSIVAQILVWLLFLWAIYNEVDKLRIAGTKGKSFLKSFIEWLQNTLGAP